MAQFENIFLIDDDQIFNVINGTIMDEAKLSKNIKSYADARLALDDLTELAKTRDVHFPELIFLDLNMPIMDGWEFIDAINKLSEESLNKCKIYILSSSVSQRDMLKSKTFNIVHGFISKPLTFEILEELFPQAQ